MIFMWVKTENSQKITPIFVNIFMHDYMCVNVCATVTS